MKAMGESVNELKHNTHSGGRNRGNTNQQRLKPNRSGGESRSCCYNCNKTGHFARGSSCPARGQNCNECGAKGHFLVCCKAKEKWPAKGMKKDNVNRVSGKTVSPSEQNDYAFVVRHNYRSEGDISLKVRGVRVEGVLIDSGASCNLIDYKTWSYLKQNHVVCLSAQSEKKIFAYGQKEPMDVAGTFTTEIVCGANGETCVDEFTVIKGDGRPLLGKRTAEQPDALRVGPEKEEEVYTVTEQGNDRDIREKYPALFTGVRKLKGHKLKLHINEDVTPVAQSVRRLPFGLRDKVDEKLDELLDMGIIEEVPEATPTTWVSPSVVVPKAGGKDIRVCVDVRRVNEVIVRERHPIPTIEKVLYDLNGVTVFSKIDLKWGFHQIELAEDLRAITTFITHKGLYRYRQLMFGVTSALEKYQKIISDVLAGCSGIANIADDLVIYGTDQEEHDSNLRKVLTRLEEQGLTVNRDKYQFRLPRLTFFGRELSARGVAPSEENIAAVVNARPPQNVSEVRSFIQLVQYSAKFIPDFAQLADAC